MKITLKNEDTLTVILPNGNRVRIKSGIYSNTSEIDIRNKNSHNGKIRYISIENYPMYNEIYTWFKGGLQKVSKNAREKVFKITNADSEYANDITLFKRDTN